MPLYNFEIEQTVRFFIQRDCADDEAAEAMKQQLEDDDQVSMSDQMYGTDIEISELEVVGGPALNGGE